MSAQMKFIIAGVCLLAAAYNIRAHDHKHLQCWHCSSDTIGAEDFCDETFKEDNIPTDLVKERNINLMRSCNSSINSDHDRAVCRKIVEDSNGKRITKRFCYYTNKSDPVELCNVTSTEKNVQRIFCEDCMTNLCNAGTQLASMLGAFLFPTLALAKNLAL